MPLLAVKEDELVFRIALGILFGTVAAVVVGSLLNALWLLLANGWVGTASVGYGKAYKTVLATNFVMLMLGLLLALPQWYVMASEVRDLHGYLLYASNPISYFYYMLGSVLVHAVIFASMLDEPNGTPLRFGRAAAVALVYLAICCAFSLVAGVATLGVLLGANIRY
jgi:hypothetical protein